MQQSGQHETNSVLDHFVGLTLANCRLQGDEVLVWNTGRFIEDLTPPVLSRGLRGDRCKT